MRFVTPLSLNSASLTITPTVTVTPHKKTRSWMQQFDVAYPTAAETAYRAGVFDANKASIDVRAPLAQI